ncbi:ethanolamine utilization protein EutJ [Photobacterium sp. DNB22_13_2]
MTNLLERVNQHLMLIDELVNDESTISAPQQWHVGIDLGTADIQTVVIDGHGLPVAAFLDWADVVRDGVVVDYVGACRIVREQLRKVELKLGVNVEHAITSYPPGTDPRISINVVESAGVLVSHVIDEPSSVAELLQIQDGAVIDVGGGTTGTAIIANGELVTSLDEPSGGRHVSLTIAGGLRVDMDEAEQHKRRSHEDPLVATMARPVIEKMADIVGVHLAGHQPTAMYLTGGGTLIAGFSDIFRKAFPTINVVEFSRALYLTPFAIASYGLMLEGKE